MALAKIEIPSEYIGICQDWHDGMNSMMYAISSSGGDSYELTLGTERPSYQNENNKWVSYTNEEWHLSLFNSLESEIYSALRVYDKRKKLSANEQDQKELLKDFYEWAEEQTNTLRAAYHLEDSEVV